MISAVSKALAMAAQKNRAPHRPLPSWETLAAVWPSSAARWGRQGLTSPQVSMKIWPPICSARIRPFCSMEPDWGAGMPLFRFR